MIARVKAGRLSLLCYIPQRHPPRLQDAPTGRAVPRRDSSDCSCCSAPRLRPDQLARHRAMTVQDALAAPTALGAPTAPAAPAAPAGVIEEDLITCSVCLDVMCDPVTIAPCGHSCCCACIELWLQRNQKCPFCTMPMLHCCLSYSLKSVVERLHGPALAARRERIGATERKTFSVALTQPLVQHPALRLLTEPALRLVAELAVFFPRLANLGWRELLYAWLLLFVVCFCAIQWLVANELSLEWHAFLTNYGPTDAHPDRPANTHPDDGECMRWAAEGQCQSNPAFMLASCLLGCNLEEHATPLDRTLLTLHRYLWALPGLFLQFFLVLFVFFFGLFYVLQKLIQRRNDQAAGLAHVAEERWAEERLVRR